MCGWKKRLRATPDLSNYLVLQVGTLMPEEEEGRAQGCRPAANAGFQDPRPSFPTCASQSRQGWPQPPAPWKPFVLSQPPSSLKPAGPKD